MDPIAPADVDLARLASPDGLTPMLPDGHADGAFPEALVQPPSEPEVPDVVPDPGPPTPDPGQPVEPDPGPAIPDTPDPAPPSEPVHPDSPAPSAQQDNAIFDPGRGGKGSVDVGIHDLLARLPR